MTTRGAAKVLPDKLRAVRKHRGFTQYSLAQASGVSESLVCLAEMGRRNLSLESVRGIAAALEVAPTEFAVLADEVTV